MGGEISDGQVKPSPNSVNVGLGNNESIVLSCIRAVSDHQRLVVTQRSRSDVSQEDLGEELTEQEIHKVKNEGNNEDEKP